MKCRPVRRASPCSAQPSPPSKPGRLAKTQAPSTTRVLRAPSSSFSVQFFGCVVLPRLRGELLDELLDALLVVLVGEVGAEGAAADAFGLVGVDALAAVAEDAGPARGQPGEVAAEHLVGVAGVGELDPGAGEVEGNFWHGTTLRLSARRAALAVTRLGTMRLAVLDVGSNTVHLLVVDAYRGARPLPAYSHKAELHLAEHVTDDGSIDESGADALVEAVREALVVAEDQGSEDLMAFATSALREAPNGAEVLERVQNETGVDLEVLTGQDEARLTFLAVRRWFGWSAGRLLVIDIGGGSLEIALGIDEEPDVTESLPLGAGRLTRDRLPGDPPSKDDVKALRKHVRAELGARAAPVRRAGSAGCGGGDVEDVQAARAARRCRAVVRRHRRRPVAAPRRPRRSGCPSSPR